MKIPFFVQMTFTLFHGEASMLMGSSRSQPRARSYSVLGEKDANIAAN